MRITTRARSRKMSQEPFSLRGAVFRRALRGVRWLERLAHAVPAKSAQVRGGSRDGDKPSRFHAGAVCRGLAPSLKWEMPRARRKAKEAQTEEREAEETAPAPSRGLGLELPELPAGWSRYFDPRHGTYLYHEATGDWHLEAEADKVLAESGREARVEADSTAWPELGASEVKELHGGGAKKGPAAFKEAAKEAARLPAPKRPPVPPIPEGRGSEPSAPGGLAGTVPASGEECKRNMQLSWASLNARNDDRNELWGGS
ncbi:hypothetical protein AK812_SmicGene20946 [Symbiodinium microadriaticum]|uniref:WW domain-containing protein n=1 Tax=Symbiodinium microadriaticum TaxID=2951 RepID=A0A1Q9DNM2_SYMMI|nr:hypothetical protein AK812_SmicGene20946 [Symbiodinium microadriaticum]